MIPRILHHIWLGPLPVPMEMIQPWRDLHPRWEHRLWREADIRALGLSNESAFERYLRGRRWHGAANVARYEILYREGGVYVDVDTVPLGSLKNAPFMRRPVTLWAAYVQPRPQYPGLIGNAYIGAEPRHPVLRAAMDLIASDPHLVPPWVHSGVVAFTKAVAAVGPRADIRILPTKTFFPHDRFGRPAPEARATTYARHLWGSTRGSGWTYRS